MNKTDRKPPKTIETLTQELNLSILNSNNDISIDTLEAQAAVLNHIMITMFDESRPAKNPPPWSAGHHNRKSVSLALRAQNQYCRALLLLDHLREKEKSRNKLEN